jgi:hypothetical protein
MNSTICHVVFLCVCAVACTPSDDPSLAGGGAAGSSGAGGGAAGSSGAGDPGASGGASGGGAPAPAGACDGQPHLGFDKVDLVADRPMGAFGANRARVKPFTALTSEFKRALGAAPAGLAGNAGAYGELSPRWYSEPVSGAVSEYTTYTLAFGGCFDTMTDAKYKQNPTASSAASECAAMQRKFWQRAPAPEQIKACSDLALGLTSESDPRRRWAHACAAVLSSAGFTTF